MSDAVPTRETWVAAHRDAPWWEWGLVIALALIPALPLLGGSGLVNTRAGGDSPFLLVRVHQLVLNLRAGVFPVRWMPQAAYGLGYPFFSFYASLSYYLAAIFKLAGLGYIGAIKLTQALGFVFAALAMYGFSKELGHKRGTSLLVALAYSCAPFHVVNVYVRGDSLSEFYAFIFFPLIPWSLLRMQKQANRETGFLGVALSYAGLMLTHNISAFIFSPFVALYTLVLAVRTPVRQRLRNLLGTSLALAAGALLSAWFWLPALAERGNVYLKDMTTGYFNYALHFRSSDLVQRSLAFNYAITADQNPFRMGLVQAILALAGLMAVLVWWIRSRRIETHGVVLVFLLASSTFMVTPLSRPLWDHLPLLPMVQFPWRFLSVQAFAASLAVAYLVPRQQRSGWLAAILMGVLICLSALAQLRPEWLLIHEDDITTQRLMLYEYFTANVGTTIRHDWLPRWVDPRPYTSEAFWQGETKPTPLTLEGQVVSAKIVRLGPTSEHWAIEVASPRALLAFQTYYYPGWESRVDGQTAAIEVLPGLGYIGLRLGQGQHDVHLRLGRTRVRLMAEIVSALTATVLLFMLVRETRFPRRMLGLVAMALTILALLIGRYSDNDELLVAASVASAAPRTTPVITSNPAIKHDLTMDFDRIPYLHHNPDGIRFADAARFTQYALSSEVIRAGETLTVTTYWDSVRRYGLLARVSAVPPAQHLFATDQTVASSERPLTADRLQHTLTIPATTMRGIYLLTVQVYNPDGEIRPTDARGENLGTTYLLPVRIIGEVPASGDEPTLQRFGQRIALSKAQTLQNMAGTLDITLTWRVLASPPQNYKVALRLKDPSGWDVARVDTQPGYGFYPTSMWRPGELVYDRYVLPLDDGTPPGTAYSLDVTLYESASLRPIGTVTIPNVAVTQPTVRQDYQVLHHFGLAIALSEVQLPRQELEQGTELTLLLKWAATTRPDRDYACQVALLDQAGTVAFSQTVRLAGEYASSLWPENAIVTSHYAARLNPDFPAGQYTIALTVIEALSGKGTGTFVLPASVRIVEAARNFTVPAMLTSVGAEFGEQVRLLGYDLQRTEKELVLTLHWQALAEMGTDYKVFVHLFDPQTEEIAVQQDILAGGDSHPTTRWVPKEVVSSRMPLSLEGVSAGVYRLAVGLYHPAGRLPVTAPPEFTVSADRLLLSETVSMP